MKDRDRAEQASRKVHGLPVDYERTAVFLEAEFTAVRREATLARDAEYANALSMPEACATPQTATKRMLAFAVEGRHAAELEMRERCAMWLEYCDRRALADGIRALKVEGEE